MRIVRTILLLCGATVFLPSPPEDAAKGDLASQAMAAPNQGLLASATVTIADVASFCSRQPEVCDTAGYLAGRLEAKAKYSVKLVYEWANAPAEPELVPPKQEQAESADPLTTGTARMSLAQSNSSQSTLKLEDLIPEWRGPPPKNSG